MDYPLNMRNVAAGGFAVANDEAEHKALSEMGYEPKHEGAVAASDEGEAPTVDSVRAKLDEMGIPYKKTLGLAKLLELLPE